MHSGHRGTWTETKAKLLYLERGWQVFSPDGAPSETDLIVYHAATMMLYRVQAKSGGQADRASAGRVSLMRSRSSGRPFTKYGPNDFDLLFVADRRDGSCYIVDWHLLCQNWAGSSPQPTSMSMNSLRHARADLWEGWELARRAEMEQRGAGVNGAPRPRDPNLPRQLTFFDDP